MSALYLGAGVLLTLGLLGHTFGGMLGTARTGPRAGAEADRVMREMRETRFTWNGADSSWYAWWLGNGLCVSALLVVPITTLYWAASVDGAMRAAAAPILITTAISLVGVSALAFRYFAVRIGAVFGLVTALAIVAVVGG